MKNLYAQDLNDQVVHFLKAYTKMAIIRCISCSEHIIIGSKCSSFMGTYVIKYSNKISPIRYLQVYKNQNHWNVPLSLQFSLNIQMQVGIYLNYSSCQNIKMYYQQKASVHITIQKYPTIINNITEICYIQSGIILAQLLYRIQ